jgi:hypothetical protein
MNDDAGVNRVDVPDLDQPTGHVRADDHRESVTILQPRIDRVA